MSKAHHRKKHPEAVRQQLLDVAAKLSLEKGPASVTLDAVSQAAGVSKGGCCTISPISFRCSTASLLT